MHPVESGDASPALGTDASRRPAIDVQLLAEKVYRLLLADARLGRSRSDWQAPPRRSREG